MGYHRDGTIIVDESIEDIIYNHDEDGNTTSMKVEYRPYFIKGYNPNA